MRRLVTVLSHALTALVALGLGSLALAQQATLVRILSGSAVVSPTNGLPVEVVAGGGTGGTSSNFDAAFPGTGTAAGFENSLSGNMVSGILDDTTGGLNVNVVGGGGTGGTSSNFAAAFPASGTAAGMDDGVNMVPLTTTDGTSLDVNCIVGCAAGTFNNNADDVATSADNSKTAAWLYLFDGTTFDRWRGDATNGALVDLGANNDVTVTGTVTANAGTNLNTSDLALEAGNLATLAGAVAGTEVQVDVLTSALPTGAATAANQQTDALTDTELRATAVEVDGSGTAGTPAGGVVTVQGQAAMTPVLVDGSGATQPVSGTVTANAGTNLNTSLLALESGGNLDTLAGTVAGTEQQVDVVASLPAGTNNIGDVDVLTEPDAGATASAVPSEAAYIGVGTDGGLAAGTPALEGLIKCNDSVVINTAASGNTQLVPLTAGETVHVCGYDFIADGDVDVQLVYGTGSACATGETDLTGPYPLAAQAGMVVQQPFSLMNGAAGNALCVELSAAVQVSGRINYTKF